MADGRFAEVVEELQSRTQLAFHGGVVPAAAFATWVRGWHLCRPGMPWSLWQWTDRIVIERDAPAPGDLDYLERGRVFGPEGDLELRRDGDAVRWRFIATPDAVPPSGVVSEDYWAATRGGLSAFERTALLWGTSQGSGVWQDDRVGWASLRYPGNLGAARRVQLRYREYLQGGAVEAVWFLDLVAAPRGTGED